MTIPADEIIHARLKNVGADVRHLHVSCDRNVLVYDAEYSNHESAIRGLPVLFAMLCVSGGGWLSQKTNDQDLEAEIGPGDIGIAAPFSPGYGSWPAMRVIGLAIDVASLRSSFGNAWPDRVRHDVISQVFRDPIVEATMMQIGYTHAGRVTDSALVHAAQLVVHQLLDEPDPKAEPTREGASIYPLEDAKLKAVDQHIAEHIHRAISVDELATISGVSRHHFGRRFKAKTGQSPYQYVLAAKLDRAAETLSKDHSRSVTDISGSIGYDNPAQFAKAFRRRFGAAPRLWRSMKRG
ncbi:MAG: helix-turn-helix domain-containing protein [Paracoccaceae bacterium]